MDYGEIASFSADGGNRLLKAVGVVYVVVKEVLLCRRGDLELMWD